MFYASRDIKKTVHIGFVLYLLYCTMNKGVYFIKVI